MLPINQIICGDNIEVMRGFPDACIDSIVTDPPAGISFMGRVWDSDKGGRDKWIAWMTGVAEQCLRIIKPGGHALVWSLPRTSHWTATAWEDAGWEPRDRLAHVFGSGFPKSANVSVMIDRAAGAEREVVGKHTNPAGNKAGGNSLNMSAVGMPDEAFITAPATDAAKQWDGWGTGLKPAVEDWWLFRKPLDGTIAANVLKHGVGAINVDACRVGTEDNLNGGVYSPSVDGMSQNEVFGKYYKKPGEFVQPQGRFPANLILSYPEDEYDEAGNLLPNPGRDEVVGLFPETTSVSGGTTSRTGNGLAFGMGTAPRTGHDDSGSAARFFYCAKSSKAERRGSKHCTIKPLDLMRYLVRLVSPIGSIVLDPFAGSGTTLEAAQLESCKFIGIELDPEHVANANKRLEQGVLF